MNLALFRHSLRGHVKLGIVFLAVMSLYGGMITAMFDPKLGESLEMMAESMPQLFEAFGMLDAGKTLTQFLSNYLYGFLYIVFPMVLIVIAATRLVARWVDTGAAAYLLAAPAGRAKIAATQALALAAVPVVCVMYAFAFCALTAQVMFPGQLDVAAFLRLNAGLLCLQMAFAGVCFLASCAFRDARTAAGVGAGACTVCILVQMLADVGDEFSWLQNCTPLALFDQQALLAGEAGAAAGCAVLMAAGLALFVLGGAVFCKKDICV